MSDIWHLGLSTSGHDPAFALVDPSGKVAFAEATERFIQDKRAWGAAPDHPSHLLSALKDVGFSIGSDSLRVAGTWKSVRAEMPTQVSDALIPIGQLNWLMALQAQAFHGAGTTLMRLGISSDQPEVRRFDHHLCHAVAACHSAPFDDARCLVIDGEGEVGAASAFSFTGRRLKRLWRSWGHGSMGGFYGWLTEACGFSWIAGEEWKVMGLAAFGNADPDLTDHLARMVQIDRGRLRLSDPDVFREVLARAKPHERHPDDPVMAAADLAASGQAAYALMVDEILRSGLEPDGGALILSGGCALNSSYNGTIAGRLPFARVHVPSAPADDGNAVGAALLSWMETTGETAVPQGDGSPFLGSRPQQKKIEGVLRKSGFGTVTEIGANAAEVVAAKLAEGKILGVMRGRAEFGPRALGHRSILADPRPADMKDRLNAKVKGREAYRPFAPVVPTDRVDEWFSKSLDSPYMSFTLPWRSSKSEQVPAVVHADNTGRLQTVAQDTNGWMTDVVEHFDRLTGVPIVLNTSFNIMGKPIVHSVEDAIGVLMTTGLDAVVIEDLLVEAE